MPSIHPTPPRQTTRELDATRARYRETLIPAERLAVMDAATERLALSGAAGRVLAPGAAAPDFILPDAHGRPVRLRERLRHGPVALVFYRGAWCPYCNLHLRGFQRALPRLASRGASLLAISPQLPDGSLAAEEKNALEFPVLSDVGNHVARAYGLVFRLPPELLAIYRAAGHALEKANGSEGAAELPLAATFLIATDGRIKLAHADADYTRRLDPDEMIAALDRLQPALASA